MSADADSELRGEMAAIRTENAKQHQAVMRAFTAHAAGGGGGAARAQASAGTTAANNRRVQSKSFAIPVGDGAEKSAGFHSSWVALMASCVAYDTVTTGLAKLIPWIINERGRDLRVGIGAKSDPELVTRVMLPTGTSVGKLVAFEHAATDDDEEEDEDGPSDEESSDEEEDPENYATPQKAREAMQAAAAEELAQEVAKRKKEVAAAWASMSQGEGMAKTAYINAILEEGSATEKKLKAMVQKARNTKLNPWLKEIARTNCPTLIPVTDSIANDARSYKAVKQCIENASYQSTKYPNICQLLFASDDANKPQFMLLDEDDEPAHEFTAFVHGVAEGCARMGSELRARWSRAPLSTSPATASDRRQSSPAPPAGVASASPTSSRRSSRGACT